MPITRLHLKTAVAVPRTHDPLPPGLVGLRNCAREARLFDNSANPLTALLQMLPAKLGKRLVFFEPTARDVSFDEQWVLNLLDALRQKDTDRYRFAMLSRLNKADAAETHFLVCKAALKLDV
ncbi:MAG: hypothetical protein AB8B47_00110 [Roseobacter sp.]